MVTMGALRDAIGYIPARLSRVRRRGQPRSTAPLDRPDPMVRAHPGHQVVVANYADGAVGLEHGEPDVLDAGHAVLPQRLEQVVPADAGAARVLLQDRAVVDEHD